MLPFTAHCRLMQPVPLREMAYVHGLDVIKDTGGWVALLAVSCRCLLNQHGGLAALGSWALPRPALQPADKVLAYLAGAYCLGVELACLVANVPAPVLFAAPMQA